VACLHLCLVSQAKALGEELCFSKYPNNWHLAKLCVDMAPVTSSRCVPTDGTQRRRSNMEAHRSSWFCHVPRRDTRQRASAVRWRENGGYLFFANVATKHSPMILRRVPVKRYSAKILRPGKLRCVSFGECHTRRCVRRVFSGVRRVFIGTQ
jgi:hypothetical protein